MKSHLLLTLCFALSLSAAIPVQAGSNEDVRVSPKEPWPEFEAPAKKKSSVFRKILLWLPNRFLDLVDAVKIDAGAGLGAGAAVRFTPRGQFGYRKMLPGMVRAGNFGRRMPVMWESSDEYGAGSNYVFSTDRAVCPGELGAGGDLGLGLYFGVCTVELVDFATGIFFFDFMGDDLR